MVHHNTCKRQAARAQFAALLLAGMFSGSAAAQLPFPVALPFEPAAAAPGLPMVPPSLDYIPSSSAAESQSPKQVVHWLGLNRTLKPGQAAAAEIVTTRPVAHAATGSDEANAVMPAFSTQPIKAATPPKLDESAEPSAAAHHSEPPKALKPALPLPAASTGGNSAAVVGGPVQALPLESLLDVEVPGLTAASAPSSVKPKANKAEPQAPEPAKLDMPAPRAELSLSDKLPKAQLQIHESFAPSSKPAGSGSFHMSDATATASEPPATSDRPQAGLPTPQLKLASPVKLDAPPPTMADATPKAAESKGQPKPAAVASSSSQRAISLRIGSTEVTPQSPTTRVFEHRSLSSYEPVINAQPVVRAVKPIAPVEPSDKAVAMEVKDDVALCTAQSATKGSAAPTTAGLLPGNGSSGRVPPAELSKASLVKAQLSKREMPPAIPTSTHPALSGLNIQELVASQSGIDPSLAAELNRLTKQLFPESRVAVKAAGDGLVVDGVAASRDEASRILALVRKAALCPVSDHVSVQR